MAKKAVRVHVKLRSTESTHVYHTTKNKTTMSGRMEMKKYDPISRKHVLYKEEK